VQQPASLIRVAYSGAAGIVSLAFLAGGVLLAIALPYSESDSFAFGDWSRQIASRASAADPINAGAQGASRPLFYELQGALWTITGVSFTAGRLFSLVFAMILLAAVWWLARAAGGQLTAALAVIAVVSIPAFTEEALMGQSDVPAAAMVAVTAALAVARRPGRFGAVALAASALLAAIAKPTTLVALVPLTVYLAALPGRGVGVRRRLRSPAGWLGIGLLVGVLYDLAMAVRFHESLLAFLRSGTGDGIWGQRAAAARWHSLLDLGLFGPVLRLPFAYGLVYGALSLFGVRHRRAAPFALAAGLAWTILGPELGGGSDPSSFASLEVGFATLGLAAVIAVGATAADENAPPRSVLGLSMVLVVPPLLVWAYGTPYADRLAAAAWPGTALLLAVTLAVGVRRLAAMNTALALAAVPVFVLAAWVGLAGFNGLHGQQWVAFRQLGLSGLGDRQRTMNIVLPGVQEALADAQPALGNGRLAVEDPRFAWFLPDRVDAIVPLRCSDIRGDRVFILSTSDENEAEARAAGGLATPSQWQACAGPRLQLLADTGNGFVVFAVRPT
jgi:4-amino-4-deoxy-L-arabinose transferase-like glycosyltransferase